jgi:hypothetical protein
MSIGDPPQAPQGVARWARVATAVLLSVFVLQGFFSLKVKSSTTDESAHLAYGRQILEKGTFHRPVRRFNSKIPASALNAIPWTLNDRFDLGATHQRLLLLSRLPTLLFGLILGWLIARWAREAFGPRAGVAAAGLFAFSPNLLAHSRLVTTDVVTTLGAFATAYALWRFVSRPSRPMLVVTGVVLGLALTTKASNFLLLPIVLLLVAFAVARSFADREQTQAQSLARRLRPGAVWVLGIFTVALVVINAVYLFEDSFTPLSDFELSSPRLLGLAAIPVLRDVPLPLPYGYVQGIDMVSKSTSRDRWTYCLGEYRKRGFPHYFLVGLLTKTTVAFLMLLLLTVGWRLGVDRGRANGVDLFLLLPAVCFFVYLSFFFHFHIGFRYALPILPFLFVFVSQLAEKRALGSPLTLTVALLLMLHAASSLRVYPHYLAYFNEPSGGPLNGWRYLIDSNLDWGQDRGRARADYMRQSPVPVIWRPRRPVAGRILVNVNDLVGLKPGGAKRYAWLRENFSPVDHVGYSQLVYDVSEEALAECCGKPPSR